MESNGFRPLAPEVYEDFARTITRRESPVYFSRQYASSSIVGFANNHFVGGILRGRHAGLHLYRDYSQGHLDGFRAVFMDRFTPEELIETIQIAARAHQPIVLVDETGMTESGDWSKFYLLDIDKMLSGSDALLR